MEFFPCIATVGCNETVESFSVEGCVAVVSTKKESNSDYCTSNNGKERLDVLDYHNDGTEERAVNESDR